MGRYFAIVGRNACASAPSLKELALIEWEELFLSPSIKAGKPVDYIFGLVESLISKADLHKSSTSPAEVILFSTLYDKTESTPSDILSLYPSLKSWFLAILDTTWAKQGIEQAAAQTSELPLEPTPVQGKPEQAFVQKVRVEAKMNITEPSQDM